MYPCQRLRPLPISRRQLLSQAANGFGAVALASLWASGELSGASFAAEAEAGSLSIAKPMGSLTTLHHPPKARNCIFLYMDGGPSQVDTFDPKPRLTAENGKPFAMKVEPTQFNNNGATLGSPWAFNQYGQSGTPVSDLFPHVAKHVDKLAVVRSMTSNFPEHTFANYFLHTGTGLQGRPSMGAWFTYGLGSECRDLPGFVVINGGLIPPGGLDNFNSGFLPATFQGSLFAASNPPVANVNRLEATAQLQKNKLGLIGQLDQLRQKQAGHEANIDAAIANYELAYRMQTVVPGLTDLSNETEEVQQLYGLDSKFPQTASFGRQCILARRLVEQGVRFIELTCPNVGHDRWDQHGNLKKGHEDNARAVDQPIAGLLEDLSRRGLLDQTLVVWAGEFGRTPFAQGSDGRDHNPFGFSIWMAGGGIKGGTIYGQTDEFGYKVVENKVEVHDLHATMMHLFGVDHRKLTFRFSGRDMRLTDVHGQVIRDILA